MSRIFGAHRDAQFSWGHILNDEGGHTVIVCCHFPAQYFAIGTGAAAIEYIADDNAWS
jgi:hypothetical protein